MRWDSVPAFGCE